MRYIWLVEGEPYAGELTDYAEALEQAAHSDIEVSERVWYAQKDFGFRTPRFISTEPLVLSRSTHDDIQTVWINVGVDEARYKIDLRV